MAEATEQAGWGAGSSEALYEKLRPGPGRSAPEVSSHQRTRLRGAMIEIAAERGYEAVTVRKLARLASVSTRSFYKHFGEKETCFLNTYERIVRLAARRAVESQGAGEDWRGRLRLGLQVLMSELAAEPKAARLVLVEAFAVGPPAQEQMSHAEAIFEAVVRASLNQAPEQPVASPPVVRAIVAGATRVARARLLAGRVRELPESVDGMVEWALSYTGEAAQPAKGIERRATPQRLPAFKLEAEEEDRRRPNGDERALVLSAVAKLAASDGYRSLSATRIRAAAGVSRRSFDAHFDDVESCFLTAVELRSVYVFAEATQEAAESESWPSGVHRAVRSLCTYVARNPTLSRLAFVEILAPGLDGLRRRERLVDTAAKSFRASAPPGQRPSELAAEASMGAVWDAIHHQVASGRAKQLPRQAATLSFILLAPALGAAAATTTIHAGEQR